MSCTISGHISPWSSRGAHDNGCGSVTVPPVGLCAVIASNLLVPAGSANDRGADHVNTDGPYCLGRAAVVGGSVPETLRRGVAGGATDAGGAASAVRGGFVGIVTATAAVGLRRGTVGFGRAVATCLDTSGFEGKIGGEVLRTRVVDPAPRAATAIPATSTRIATIPPPTSSTRARRGPSGAPTAGMT